MLIVWLGINTIIGAWLGYSVLVNPIGLFGMRKWGGNVAERLLLILLVSLLATHTGVAVAVSLLVTVRAAVVITSLIVFVSSLTAYFMLQRFAGPLDRTGVVNSNPLLYSATTLAAFLACTVALVLFGGWIWIVVPIVVWFLLGFLCAELAIRRYISKSRRWGTDCDRRRAVFALNSAQGRRSLFGMDRYPFP
jgi:hypothetical protein